PPVACPPAPNSLGHSDKCGTSALRPAIQCCPGRPAPAVGATILFVLSVDPKIFTYAYTSEKNIPGWRHCRSAKGGTKYRIIANGRNLVQKRRCQRQAEFGNHV